ncbi:MAG: hypothetical protein AB7E49_03120 [Campylobacterales bacterium]
MFELNSINMGTFLRKISSIQPENETIGKQLSAVTTIVQSMNDNPELWEANCKFNERHIGEQFLQAVSTFNSNDNRLIEDLFVMAYRFLCELDFNIGFGMTSRSIEAREIKRAILRDLESFNAFVRSEIHYAAYQMPIDMLKQHLDSPEIKMFSGFRERKEEAEAFKKKWDREVEETTTEAKKLSEALDKYKTAFNFVGLYQGFSGLSDSKEKEGRRLLYLLIVMAFVVLAPLATEIGFVLFRLHNNEAIEFSHLFVLLPLISIELILIYFFRIVLINYRSVKTQIIQLELRKTLCQFIQSYAEYSKGIKKDDKSALEKFENVIFSSVLPDPERLPTTFDGMEQITNIIQSLKKS